MKQDLVKDWMTRDVVTIPPETTLPEVDHLMAEKRIRRLPVVKDGQLVGIITRSDAQSAEPSDAKWVSVWELNYLLSTLTIEKVMTPNPITISQDATIGETTQLMLEHKISSLPVVDNQGNIVGIITESDIFRLVARAWYHDNSKN
jgi:CBS domain-containing protein